MIVPAEHLVVQPIFEMTYLNMVTSKFGQGFVMMKKA